MNVKRWETNGERECGEEYNHCHCDDMIPSDDGNYVLTTDYEALLELAIRLRKGIATTDDITLLLELVDSAWLKE